ncbi:hypothetical protein SDC9_73443 [bioreactor metagenome]|uniref:Uncharacterized protein n=1 Tax=bioreactor metagenome TaxID=1076179 RepID=A0A644YG28_9ZZZZ
MGEFRVNAGAAEKEQLFYPAQPGLVYDVHLDYKVAVYEFGGQRAVRPDTPHLRRGKDNGVRLLIQKKSPNLSLVRKVEFFPCFCQQLPESFLPEFPLNRRSHKTPVSCDKYGIFSSNPCHVLSPSLFSIGLLWPGRFRIRPVCRADPF